MSDNPSGEVCECYLQGSYEDFDDAKKNIAHTGHVTDIKTYRENASLGRH